MQTSDAVDYIVQQWEKERPDLETEAMALIGRLKRCSALLQPKLETVFSQFALSSWEFDVLATLLRSGKPYCLAPTELFSTLMITSGTMTHRLNQLEKRALIFRQSNSQDARSKLVKLTKKGRELISQAVAEHTKNETQILAHISKQDRVQLNTLLKTLLAELE